MRLRIKQSSWSGWSEDYKPKENEREYDVNLKKYRGISLRKFFYNIKWYDSKRLMMGFKLKCWM